MNKDYVGQELKVGDFIMTYYDSCGNMMVGKIFKISKRIWFNEIFTKQDQTKYNVEGVFFKNNTRFPERVIKLSEQQVKHFLEKRQ